MKKWILILIGTFIAFDTYCQINESDTVNFALQIQAGGSYQKGNVELTRIANRIGVLRALEGNLVVKTQNNYLFQKIVGNKADENIESRNFIYYDPQARFYPYALIFISTNFRRELNQRYFGGLGITYQLFNTVKHNLKLSGNVLYEKSEYTLTSYNESSFDGDNEIKSFWHSFYLSGFHRLNAGDIRFVYELYWQQSNDKSVNYRYHIFGGLDFKMIKNLSLQTRYEYTYENVVISGNKTSDTLWTWGLIYNLKSK